MMSLNASAIFKLRHRGLLLDALVLVVNLLLMTILASRFRELSQQANHPDATAKGAMALFCFAMAFLQPAAAILKRRRAHERNPSLSLDLPWSIIINRVFYFLSQLCF